MFSVTIKSNHASHNSIYLVLPRAFFKASLPRFAIAACSFLPATLARCSTTVKICILRAYGLLILLTLATVALASAGVAYLILTVSFGFSSVYLSLIPL